MSDDNELRKRYDDARSVWSEWRTRALEDLRFSNPANPQQWDPGVISARGRARPALVFDQTNQYIGQVVNDARQNRPSIDVLPGDADASDEAAEFYGGLIRQIEYASRAGIAYDTAVEYAARIGMGYILVVPEMIDQATNDHDIRIKAVHDPLAVTFDPDSIEPDGQDADCGWLETRMSESAFKRRWKKAKPLKALGDRFYDGRNVTVCQVFERKYESQNRIVTLHDGADYSEDEYHAASQQAGFALPVHATYTASTPKVVWSWWNGEEILEQTDYPAPYIGLIPVYGNLLWVDGKREICGMTRRMMDACRAYNYARSAEIEAAALQPKAPWLAVGAAIARYQARWDASNRENAAVLPWDHKDESGEPLPEPKRQDPPQIGAAFPMLSQQALQDVQASVGMYKANLGQNSNAKSGVAINRLQTEGDTATFHYIDNLSRSIEQVGRIAVAMIPTYYDRAKVAAILGIDGKPGQAYINPELETAHEDGDILQVNPAKGKYTVRVKTGPSYTTQRQEMADKLVQIGQSNPPLAAALSPLVLQMADMPGADKAIRVAMALLPPDVRQAYDDKPQEPQITPEVQQAMQQAQAHIAQLTQALQGAASELNALKSDQRMEFNKMLIDAYDKETNRLKVLGTAMTPQMVQQLVMQTIAEVMERPDPMQGEIAPPPMGPTSGDEGMEGGMPMAIAGGPPPMMGGGGAPMPMHEAPQGAFSLPSHPSVIGPDAVAPDMSHIQPTQPGVIGQ